MRVAGEETEVKVALSTAEWNRMEEKLARVEARLAQESQPEENFVYDFADLSLTKSGSLLRLRTFAGTALLTFKGPMEAHPDFKRRPEWETEVADPGELRLILESLGLRVSFQYAKVRAVYQLPGPVEICLDETPVGYFAEIEGPPQAIYETAGRLGWGEERFIRKTYRELYREQGGEAGS